jgi:hypothetical protein
MGIVSMFTRGLNQDGDVVLSWKRSVMIPRRGQGIGENYFPAAKANPLTSTDMGSSRLCQSAVPADRRG